MRYNKEELNNLLIVSKFRFNVSKKKLKENYFEILKSSFSYMEYTEVDKSILDKYLYKEIICYLDNEERKEWFILEDNNYVIPNDCFEL